MTEPAEPKARHAYRLTRYSIVWVVAIVLLVPYEIWCVVNGVDGGPLTHVVKTGYGEPQSARWWLVGMTSSGFILWMVPHFLFDGWELRALLTFVGSGFLVGIVGWLVTQIA